jgi:hypothetical protein
MLPIESGLRVEFLIEDRHREAYIANQHVREILGPKRSPTRTLLEAVRRLRPTAVPETSPCAVAEPAS